MSITVQSMPYLMGLQTKKAEEFAGVGLVDKKPPLPTPAEADASGHALRAVYPDLKETPMSNDERARTLALLTPRKSEPSYRSIINKFLQPPKDPSLSRSTQRTPLQPGSLPMLRAPSRKVPSTMGRFIPDHVL